MSPKQEKYVENRLQGVEKPDAALAAGYKAKDRNTAAKIASRLEDHPTIRAALQPAVEAAMEKAGVTREWITAQLRANYERAMQAEPVLDGKGLPTGEYRYDGSVANRALELLGKDLKMFRDGLDVTQTITREDVTRLVKNQARATREIVIAELGMDIGERILAAIQQRLEDIVDSGGDGD